MIFPLNDDPEDYEGFFTTFGYQGAEGVSAIAPELGLAWGLRMLSPDWNAGHAKGRNFVSDFNSDLYVKALVLITTEGPTLSAYKDANSLLSGVGYYHTLMQSNNAPVPVFDPVTRSNPRLEDDAYATLYSAYGLPSEQRWGGTATGSLNSREITQVYAEWLLNVCQQVRDAGVELYVVLEHRSVTDRLIGLYFPDLWADSLVGRNALRNCALPGYYYDFDVDTMGSTQLADIFQEIARRLTELRLSR